MLEIFIFIEPSSTEPLSAVKPRVHYYDAIAFRQPMYHLKMQENHEKRIDN